MKKEIIMKRYQEINEKIGALLKECEDTKSYIDNKLSGDIKIGFKYLYDNHIKTFFKSFDTAKVTLRMIFELNEKDYSVALKEIDTLKEVIGDVSKVIQIPLNDIKETMKDIKDNTKSDEEALKEALNKLFNKQKENSKS